MERLISVMCWLFKSEQHLEKKTIKLKERHEVVEVEVTFEKKTVGSGSPGDEDRRDFYILNGKQPPTQVVTLMSSQVPCAGVEFVL
jgi:hypothetical protein